VLLASAATASADPCGLAFAAPGVLRPPCPLAATDVSRQCSRSAGRVRPVRQGVMGLRAMAAETEPALSPALCRLAQLLQPQAGQTKQEAQDLLHTALMGICLEDFGTKITSGWVRCYRSTRIVLKEDSACSISVLLLPAGERLPPYSRPGAEVCGYVVLKGAAGLRSFACGEAGKGAILAKGLPEDGLHDARSRASLTNKNGCITPEGSNTPQSRDGEMPDCVCRGGLCPRREGCTFWVELMRERLQRKKAWCVPTCLYGKR